MLRKVLCKLSFSKWFNVAQPLILGGQVKRFPAPHHFIAQFDRRSQTKPCNQRITEYPQNDAWTCKERQLPTDTVSGTCITHKNSRYYHLQEWRIHYCYDVALRQKEWNHLLWLPWYAVLDQNKDILFHISWSSCIDMMFWFRPVLSPKAAFFIWYSASGAVLSSTVVALICCSRSEPSLSPKLVSLIYNTLAMSLAELLSADGTLKFQWMLFIQERMICCEELFRYHWNHIKNITSLSLTQHRLIIYPRLEHSASIHRSNR
jgi:hypothetical protein